MKPVWAFIDILPRTDKFLTSLNQQVTRSLTAAGKTASGQMSMLTKAVGIGFVALGALAVTAITKGISATEDWALQTYQLQQVTGQTAESASALLDVTNDWGISTQKLATGFGLLAKNITNANPLFEKYNIATKDANGNSLSFDEVLGNVSDKFLTLKPGAEQAAFAMNVFGRSGKNLIPLLQQGAAGIEELKKQSEAAGLVMSQQDVNAARELAIAQQNLGDAVQGASISIGKAFIPAATALVEGLTKIVELFTAIPAPIKTATSTILILTGAVAGLQLVAGGFLSTWAKLGTTLGVTTAATEGATVATTGLATSLGVVAAELAPVVALFVSGKAALDEWSAFKTEGWRGAITSVLNSAPWKLFFGSVGSGFTMAAKGAEDLGKAAQLTEPQLSNLVQTAGKLSAPLERFSEISGQSMDSVLADLQKLNDPKLLADPAKRLAVWSDAMTKVKDAAAAWHDSIVQNFGGASAALDQFFGTRVNNFDKMNQALLRQKGALKDWSGYFDTILKTGGKAAQTFLQDMSDQGLGSIGILRELASQPKKVRDEFLSNYNAVNGATNSIADQITKAFGDTFDRIIFQLRNIARVMQGLPPIKPKVDTSQLAGLSSFLDHIMGQVAAINASGTGVVVSTPRKHMAAGGIIEGALGFTTNRPTFLVGEAGKEAVIPLEHSHALADALREAMADMGMGRARMDRTYVAGQLQMSDWRNGIATLGAEQAWEDTVRTR